MTKKMASLNYFHLITLIIIFLTTATATGGIMVSPSDVKAAYWPSWSTDSFPPSAIDTTFFTHIYYAFLSPSNVTFKFELSASDAMLLLNFTTTLRHKNPPVKTLVSFGGGGSDPLLYASMASKAKSRKNFINSAIEVARKFGFDGLDLDWEWPQGPQEMINLGHLFKEWRFAIQEEARSIYRAPLLLTAAVYFSVDFFLDEVYRKYPVDSIDRYLDWASPMCFDYQGSWDTSHTGAHAALFDPKSNLSTSYGLQSWIRAGVQPGKLVMGLPLYGKTWELKDPNVNGIGAPAVGVGPGVEGVLHFSELVDYGRTNGAIVVYDPLTVSVYSYSGTTWIGYDDATSTAVKLRFAQGHGLRGYFFWALSFDREWEISKQASKAWLGY